VSFKDVPTTPMSWLLVSVMNVAKVIVTVASTFTEFGVENYIYALSVMMKSEAGYFLRHLQLL